MNIFSKITKRTMLQNKSRTLVTLIGVVLSTAMITAVTSFGASLQKFLVDSSISQEGDWHGMAAYIDQQEKEYLEGDERISQSAAIGEIGYGLWEDLGEAYTTPYLYLESFSEEAFRMIPIDVYEGRLPENDREILIPSLLSQGRAEGMELRVGDTLSLTLGKRLLGGETLTQRDLWANAENRYLEPGDLELMGGEETFQPEEQETFTVVGFYSGLPWSGYGEAGYSVIAGPGVQEADSWRVLLRLDRMGEIYSLRQELKESCPEAEFEIHDDLLQWYGVGDNRNLALVMMSLMAIVIGLIMVGGISLIYNAFSISLRERTRQFGLLSSVGATKKQLKKALNYEAASVCLLGIPLGLLGGLIGIGITLQFIGPLMANWIHGVDQGIPLKVSWIALAIAVLFALITVRISVWIPARRLKHLSAMEAIRSSQDVKISSRKVRSAGLGGKLFGLEGMLASKNYRRDKRKYRTTVVSLTLSIVLFVTAGAFVKYLNQAGQDVFANSEMDLYVDLTGVEELDAALLELQQTEGVEEVSFCRQLNVDWIVKEELLTEEGKLHGWERADGGKILDYSLVILPDEQFAAYAQAQGIDPEEFLGQEKLKGIYVDRVRSLDPETQQYQNRSLLNLQGPTEVELGREQYDGENNETSAFEAFFSLELTARAEEFPRETMASYFSDTILVTLPESSFGAYEEQLKDILQQEAYLKAPEHREVAQQLIDKAQDRNSALYQHNLYDMRENTERDQNILLVIRVLTGGFVGLMSLVAVANIFNTISTNLFLRRREFAVLRSIGMTQRGFRRMMGCECLIYGLRSIFYGVLISVGTSYLVYRGTSFGVRYDYSLPWIYWGISVAAVLLVVGITMIYSMRKMRGDNIIDELKQE